MIEFIIFLFTPILLFVISFIICFIMFVSLINIQYSIGFHGNLKNIAEYIKIKHLKLIFVFYLILYVCYIIGHIYLSLISVNHNYWSTIIAGFHIITLWFSGFYVIYFYSFLTSDSISDKELKQTSFGRIINRLNKYSSEKNKTQERRKINKSSERGFPFCPFCGRELEFTVTPSKCPFCDGGIIKL